MFQFGTRKIWVLNHSAAFIWSLLETTANLEDLALQVVHEFQISLSQACKDTESVVASFRAEGLLGMRFSGELDITEQTVDILPPAKNVVELPCPQWVERLLFITPHHCLELCSSDTAIALEFQRAMHHFEGTNRSPGSFTQLSVTHHDSLKREFDIFLNGHLYLNNVSQDDAVIALLSCAFSQTAEALFDKILFHAAVLERAGKAFIFPGDAGRGKTTLAALLSKKGYGFISDELAVVDPDTDLITPLPLPMSIKKGAWPILRPLYPELDAQKVYVRADGKEVKILTPEVMSDFDGHREIAPAALIFPKHDPDSPAEALELAKAEAIRRLAASCSSSRPLMERDIASIIRLVDNHPCFSVTYSDCAMVEELLEDIIRGLPLP